MPKFLLSSELLSGAKNLEFSPYVNSLDAGAFQSLDYTISGSPYWQDMPIRRLARMSGLVLTSDAEIGLRLYGQLEGEMYLTAGGVFVLWHTNIVTVTASVVQVWKPVGSARIQGIAVGTPAEGPDAE